MSNRPPTIKSLAQAWRAMGAPRDADEALAFGREGPDLGRAVDAEFAPTTLTLLNAKPSPRSRYRTSAQSLADLAAERPGGFDLVLAAGGLEEGDLSQVRDRLVDIANLLAPGGVLAAAIDTLAAPHQRDDGPFDALLFPHLARYGELGEAAQARAPLPASAWRALVQASGLDVMAAEGFANQPMPDDLMEQHAARLSAYDARELASGRLILLARKPGGIR